MRETFWTGVLWLSRLLLVIFVAVLAYLLVDGFVHLKGTWLPGQGNAAPPTFALRSPQPGTISPEAASSTAGRIVVVECAASSQGELVLDLIDPSGTRPTLYRAFNAATPGTRFAASCESTLQAPVQRSSFSVDFSQLVVVRTSMTSTGGASQVVVLQGSAPSTQRPASASDDGRAVTALQPDVAGTAAYASAAFGPDGRVYFMRIVDNGVQAIQSVSPNIGAASVRDEPTSDRVQSSGDSRLYFPPGCTVPHIVTLAGGACVPGGSLEYGADLSGTQTQVQAGAANPYTFTFAESGSGAPPSTVWPFASTDAQSFLAGDNGLGLYRATKSGANSFVLTRVAAIPPGLNVNDPALSPDHNTIAFLGRTGVIAQICVVPVSGGTPAAVAQYKIGHSSLATALSAHVLGWTSR